MIHEIARAWDHVWWVFLHATGADNPSGVEYGFWSGAGSDLSEIVLLGGLWQFARQYNCHEPRCWRLGPHHYDMDGQMVKLCRKHHPKIGKLTRGQVQAHNDAQSAP